MEKSPGEKGLSCGEKEGKDSFKLSTTVTPIVPQ